MISRPMFVPTDALPHDRMRDARIRADKDQHIGLFKILVRVRRRVEPERLLVGRRRRGHALARVAVAMKDAHAKLGQSAQERQFLGADLAGAEPGNRVGAEFILDGFEAQRKDLERGVPIDRLEVAVRIAQVRRRRAVGRAERGERLPTFRASHPEIDRIIGGGAQIDGLPILEVDSQTAAGRTKAADHVRRVVRLESGRHLAQPKIAWMQNEILSQLAIPQSNERVDLFNERMFSQLRCCLFHDAIPPGILGGITAVKNR